MYLGIMLKIIMAVVGLMLVTRVMQLVKINKNKPGQVFRNSDGDFLVLALLFAAINKSYFDKYKMSYELILRYVYTIVIFCLISYILIQLTQLVLLAQELIVFDNNELAYRDISQMTIKKGLVRYKVTIKYRRKNKVKTSYFKVSEKASKEFELKAEMYNIEAIS